MKTLRDYQTAAKDSIIPYWENTGANPLLVIPTGGGKSLIQASLISDFIELCPTVRFLCLAHRKELIVQNSEELQEFNSEINFGIYSASLNRKEMTGQVTFGQIQSIAKHIHKFEPFDIIFIDECHLVPFDDGTLYRKALKMALLMNPKTKLIGLTATHYRLGRGFLHQGDDRIFDGIAYEISVRTLLDQGHLVPIVSKSGCIAPDLSRVHRRGGEYIQSELENAYDVPEVTQRACDEVMQWGIDRKAWLIFAAGVKHAHSVKAYLDAHNIDCEVVTGQTGETERDSIIDRFKAGQLKCIVNCDVLTTGFNAPICDLISLLRATESTSLYVQILGRGMRLSEDKTGCLLLDYGGNVLRHGFVDSVNVRGAKGLREPGDMPAKPCPICSSILHLSVMTCIDCGYMFPIHEVKHDDIAYDGAVLMGEPEPAITSKVIDVWHRRHKKTGKPDSVKVGYKITFLFSVTEYICLDHDGYARRNALRWCERMGIKANTTEELLKCELPKVEEVTYRKNGKFYDVEKVKISKEIKEPCLI